MKRPLFVPASPRCLLLPVAAALSMFAAPAFAQSAGAGETPSSNAPLTTASASAPVTVPLNRKVVNAVGSDTPTPPPAETFTYTITGLDKDTWYQAANGTTKEYVDSYLSIVVGTLQYADVTAPSLRGSAADGTKTWDIVGRGQVIWGERAVEPVEPETVFNEYTITNSPDLPGGRNPILNDPPVTARQALIKQGYQM